MEINPFTDVSPIEVSTSESERKGATFFSDVRQLEVGIGGGNIVRVTPDGIWAGAEKFADAPFSVDMTGAVIASKLTAVGGIITGGTVQTAATGQRVVLSGTTNSLKFFDANGQVIGIGTESGRAIQITCTGDTPNGILITADDTVGGNGFYFQSTGNVRTRGLYIEKTNAGANNNYPAIEIQESGSGEAIFCQIKGSGAGVEIWREDGTGTDYSLKISTSIAYNTKGILVEKTNATGTGTLAEFSTVDSGIGLKVYAGNATSGNPAVYFEHNSASSDAFVFKKTSSQNTVYIEQTANDGSNCVGLKMNVANAGAGTEYAFHFAGSEYDASKTGVSGLTGVIKILTADGPCYIPVYDTAS